MNLEGNVTSKQTLQGGLSAQYGTRGQSAYEVAVALGFEGTEEEWLASLEGDNGKSAYEYAKEGGFKGTEEEFAQKLAGDVNLSKYLEKVTGTTGQPQVYIKRENGTQDVLNILNAPNEGASGVVSKKYVDDVFVPKFDGSKETGDFRFTVYGQSLGKERQVPTSSTPKEGALAVYGSGETLQTNLVRNEFDCANKKYVDDRVGSKDIITSASGEVITTTDSAKAKPKNIKLFGKSIQNGTPSMDNEVAVESLGESGSIGGKVLRKNFLPNNATSKTENGVTFTVNEDKSVTIKGTPTTQTFFYIVTTDNTHLLQSGHYILSGGKDEVDISFYKKDWVKFGHSYLGNEVDAVLTEDTECFCYLELKQGVAYNTTIYPMIRTFGTDNTYEPYTEQPFTFQIPNGLRGIPLGTTIPDVVKNSPIHMSGVYHDGEQYWIGDTKNENGKDVQRIGKIIFDGSDDEGWKKPLSFTCIAPITNSLNVDINDTYLALLTHEKIISWNRVANKYQGACVTENTLRIYNSEFVNGTDELKGYLQNNPMTLVYVLAEPIVTDSTEQYDVVMNYPNTTIVNDEGAYMEVEYVADTKCYIDNKFKEMTSAIAQLL